LFRERIAVKKASQIRKLPHITIGVSDLKRSLSFYQDVVGLEKMGEWPSYAMFDVGGVTFGLQAKGKLEICLLVDDVDEAYRNLKDRGARFATEPKDQPWGGRAATFSDPDGNKVTIESFHCNVCGAVCESYREFLEQHLKKHR